MLPDRQPWGFGEVGLGLILAQILAVVATILAMSAAGWTKSADIPMWAGALLQVPLWGGYVGAVILAGRQGGGVRADFGLSFRAIDVPVGLVVGVAVQLLVLPALYWPILRLIGRTSDDLSAPARALSDKAQDTLGWVLLTLIVVVGAPIVEELFFRGLLLRALQKRGSSDAAACLVSAAIFAAIHIQLLQFVGLFTIGLVLAVMAVRTGRLGMSICTHAAFNATSVLVLYLTA